MTKKILFVLFICLCSSSAFLLSPLRKYWTELSETDAKRQTINIPSWAPLVKISQPAVVVITTEALSEQAHYDNNLPGPFRFFVPPSPEKQRGQGSGFIYNDKGLIVTNEHVIAGAQKIKVTIGDNPREYDAKVVGSDELLDVAILKIMPHENDNKEVKKWPVLPLGDSDKLELGDNVMALGSPLGLLQSVNVGIISHKQRGGVRPSGRDLIVDLIQMQMPINPGNSGGPVLDTSGQVVGVSESILASGQAIAFCVPINIIKQIIPQLEEKGYVAYSFLGVEITQLTPAQSKLFAVPYEKGVVISKVYSNTPAEKAKLKAGDLILEIDKQEIFDKDTLRNKTILKGAGQTVLLKIARKKEALREIKVTLEEHPAQKNHSERQKSYAKNNQKISIESVGLKIADMPDDNPGVMVLDVTNNSVSDLASIARGDIILQLNDHVITSARQLQELIDRAPENSMLSFITKRGNIMKVREVRKVKKRIQKSS